MKMSITKLSLIFFLAVIVLSCIYIYINISNTSKYSDIINKYAVQYNIDPILVKAIIKSESNFNALAKSKKGAIGLMQLMPSTGKEVAITHLGYKVFMKDSLYEPEVNIMLGVCYLKILSIMFNNNTNLVLASYNAGLGNVKQWHQNNPYIQYDSDEMPFLETKKYVAKTNRIYRILKFIESIRY